MHIECGDCGALGEPFKAHIEFLTSSEGRTFIREASFDQKVYRLFKIVLALLEADLRLSTVPYELVNNYKLSCIVLKERISEFEYLI